MLLSIVVISIVLAAWGLAAARLERLRISSPLLLVLAGAVVEYTTHGTLADTLNSETAEHAAQIILAVLLFVDANTIRSGLLGAYPRSATRLLFLALPLSLALAVALGLWLLPGLSWPIVLIIACIVVPIDFAPSPNTIRDVQVPSRVRKLLNVEAGYNDGIISPVFVFALAMADHQDGADTLWEQVSSAVPHAVLAIVVGLGVGAGLAVAANAADRAGLTTRQSGRVIVVVAPALAYTLSLAVGANGFVAAFLCGIGYHVFRHSADPEHELELLDDIGFLLTSAMWFVLGGVALIAYWRADLTVGIVVFCLLALTLIRMLPVELAMLRSGFPWSQRLLLGWLGPRGASSIVFGLLAFNVIEGGDENTILLILVVVVLGSVLLHGFGAPAAARAFARARSE
ncbi:sodium:proton exchanger [Mycobacterium sp. MS1601]|uniref:cation:proton antiporter domain-containing protein n=1 Tax=Mycobacterium sp. MS1601 TaxID=1936029 RepID=UPI0009796C67|nr:cation:proton antiporter [Mycobacterium sp. MS1601]AQA02435.1 sodium:proton exchanger [Mycobacterium sp. MS1601]